MRGRKIKAGDSSCILFVRHNTSCPVYGNNSPTLGVRRHQGRPISRREPTQYTTNGNGRSHDEIKGGRRSPAGAQGAFGTGRCSPANPKATALKTTTWSGRWINESKNGSKMESTNVKAALPDQEIRDAVVHALGLERR
jgi:hypothetical protein